MGNPPALTPIRVDPNGLAPEVIWADRIDPARAVEVGQSLCPLLADRSQNTADIASTVADRLGRPLGPATMFTGIAVGFFCPRAVQDLADGRSPIPLPFLSGFGN